MEQFPQVRTQVLQQVTLIDKAMEEFTEAIEKAIEELVQYRNKTVGELQTLKAELSRETETAVEEVERTLVEAQSQLPSRLGSAFRALVEHLEPLPLFSYSLHASSPSNCGDTHFPTAPPTASNSPYCCWNQR